jgi:hypothetical protein
MSVWSVRRRLAQPTSQTSAVTSTVADDSLAAATEAWLVRKFLNEPEKPQDPALTGTSATSSAGVSGQEDDFVARFRGLGEALVELATEETKQQTANLKTVGWVRRVRLVTNLFISLAVQGLLLVWLHWEVTHISSHSNLAPSIAANIISGAYTGASAYMLIPRTRKKSNVYPGQVGATRAESESVNGNNQAGQGPSS